MANCLLSTPHITGTPGLCNSNRVSFISHMAGLAEELARHTMELPLHMHLRFPVWPWKEPSTVHFFSRSYEFIISRAGWLSRKLTQNLRNLPIANVIGHHWLGEYSFSRLAAVTLSSSIPGIFLLVIANYPRSWAARYRNRIAHMLHFVAIVAVASQGPSIQDLTLVTLVIALFAILDRYHLLQPREVGETGHIGVFPSPDKQVMERFAKRNHHIAQHQKEKELASLKQAVQQKGTLIAAEQAKLMEIRRQHQTDIQGKTMLLQELKNRLGTLESQRIESRSSAEQSLEEHHTAVMVKFRRINSTSGATDRSSAGKKEDVAENTDLKASNSGNDISETLAKLQAELRRYRDMLFQAQESLLEERVRHEQTQNALSDVTKKLEMAMQGVTFPGRLPPIEEHDRMELEAMFNSAQQENVRLHTELDAANAKIELANSHITANEEEIQKLGDQLLLEKQVMADMQTARPSVVHRVHYQRMEGLLQESQVLVSTKDDEIRSLKEVIASKDKQIVTLQKGNDAAKEVLETENQRLKSTISELEATKQQLMADHERLAKFRARDTRMSTENASNRSSIVTLVTNGHSGSTPSPSRPQSQVLSGRPKTAGPEIGVSPVSKRRSLLGDSTLLPSNGGAERRKSVSLKGVKGLMKRMSKLNPDHAARPATSGKNEMEMREVANGTDARPKTAKAALDGEERPKSSLSRGWTQS